MFYEQYGFLSVLPPLIAILVAIKTREVFSSLLLGIFLGSIILSDFNIFSGLIKTAEILVDVFKDPGNTRTIIFCSLIGSLIFLVQSSGGVEGFVIKVESQLKNVGKTKPNDKKLFVQFGALLSGFIIFIETNISLLTTGTIFRPVFDKYKISREKLAYIADSSSSPVCVLIPFNAWGAFVTGLLAAEGVANSFGVLISTIPFNFYALFALLILVFVILTRKDFGPMKKAERRTSEDKLIHWPNSRAMVSDSITATKGKKGIPHKSKNMIIPIGIMVLSMPFYLLYTGFNNPEFVEGITLLDSMLNAFNNASGSSAVLYSVSTAIIFAMVLYRTQKIFTFKEMIDLTLKGMGNMLPIALLMLLAFGIGNICRELETGIYVAEISKEWLSPNFVPVILFIVSGLISFSTGTSWGTFAIMIAIAVPLANNLGLDLSLSVAAVLSGGIFGDHCSPISDTTIVASMASACDHIDHVKTQLPYALFTALLASIAFILLGITTS